MAESKDTTAHRPQVSIFMMTFRHERWIGQAIESVLAQDLEDWEIVLADDASDDRTVEVATSYLARCEGPFGKRLRILPFDEKVGQRPNFMRAMRACRGEFINQLDGDDFFIDPKKLIDQVAFLDANPELAGVFGDWLETDENGENGVLTEGFGLDGKTRFGFAEFGAFCRTTSVAALFRRDLFGDFPEWFARADVGDWPLHVLNLVHGGDYGYVPGVLAAHRNHGDGIWTKRSDVQKAKGTTDMQDMFLAELPTGVADGMLPEMLGANMSRGRMALRDGNPEAALVFFEWCAAHRLRRPSRFKLWKLRRRALRAMR